MGGLPHKKSDFQLSIIESRSDSRRVFDFAASLVSRRPASLVSSRELAGILLHLILLAADVVQALDIAASAALVLIELVQVAGGAD